MKLPTETMKERFIKAFEGYGVSMSEDEDNFKFESPEPSVILAFIESELSLSQNRILEEVEKELKKRMRDVYGGETHGDQFEEGQRAELKWIAEHIIKLISKKDIQSTLTKGN